MNNEIEFKELLTQKFNQYFNENLNQTCLDFCLNHYIMLCKYNEQMNLTKITTPIDAVLYHYIDSFFIFKAYEELFKDNISICDIGSGGGFPALPLYFYLAFHKNYYNIKLVLIESIAKKTNFLNTTINSLKLNNNVKAIPLRAEEAGKNFIYKEKFDIVTARAVAFLPTLLEYTSPFLKLNGFCFLMKGEDISNELNQSQNAIKEFKLKFTKNFTYEFETLKNKRSILIFQKIDKLSNKYPRKIGLAKKQPIL